MVNYSLWILHYIHSYAFEEATPKWTLKDLKIALKYATTSKARGQGGRLSLNKEEMRAFG